MILFLHATKPRLAAQCAWLLAVAMFAACLPALATAAPPSPRELQFAIVHQPDSIGPSEDSLVQALAEADRERQAFIILTGVKSATEPCTDSLYDDRRQLLADARNDVILALSAADWAECKREDGSPAAMDRLARMREVFFSGAAAAGRGRLAVMRQSASAQFRGFPENLRWEAGGVLFGTVNLPGDNNHFLPAAGSNSEFEDRMIANRAWLHRLLQAARARKTRTIVLFFDGDPRLATPPRAGRNTVWGRDGYFEFRRQLRDMAALYPGRLVLVHQASGRAAGRPLLAWQGNLGQLELAPGTGWTHVRIDLRTGAFSLRAGR
ncbi:MAG: hypothetical protein JWP36_1609 [Paucimonas sp.]|nr:hypothetical protein [Paucimonas sp.]